MIQWSCADCGQGLAVAEESAGKSVRCQQCGKVQEVPAPGDAAPRPAAGPPPSAAAPVPAGPPSTALDREAAEHEAFARSRLGIYIGREPYFQQLDAFATGQIASPGLVVLGATGAGKSALLANWLARYRASHPEDLVLPHFISALPNTAAGAFMLRRLMAELRRRLGPSVEIPERVERLRPALVNGLYQAAAQGRLVLVLDGLDALEIRGYPNPMIWLPAELPANVRLIVSAEPSKALEEVSRRGWPTLTVQPLDPPERRRLIGEYLRRAGRNLGEPRVERIAAAEQSANPLFLRTVLAELCLAPPELLDHRLQTFLAAPGPEALFTRMLERFEGDFERQRPGLVGEAMTLLWAARRGLSEEELLSMLGNVRTGEPLPVAQWTPLRLAAGHALVSFGGRFGFSHDAMRRAVVERYTPRPEQRKGPHWRLAAYFRSRGRTSRAVEESPFQLVLADGWEQLYRLLSDPEFIQAAWSPDGFEVKAAWSMVEMRSPLRRLEGYRLVLQDPASYVPQLGPVAQLLEDKGHDAEALRLRDVEIEHYHRAGDKVRLAESLNHRALLLQDMGDLEAAVDAFQEAERTYRELGDQKGVQACLGRQEVLARHRNDLDGALNLLQGRERLCRQLGDADGLAQCLINQGGILRRRGDLDGALALQEQAERVCRQVGLVNALSYSLYGQALIRVERGDVEGALPLLAEQEGLCRQLHNPLALNDGLDLQVRAWQSRGDSKRALALLEEKVRVCREIGDPEKLAESLLSQAGLLGLVLNQPQAALPLLEEAGQLAKQNELKDFEGRLATLRTKVEQQRGFWPKLKALFGKG
jgi:tetratricopeptide (TPR) repeat protein